MPSLRFHLNLNHIGKLKYVSIGNATFSPDPSDIYFVNFCRKIALPKFIISHTNYAQFLIISNIFSMISNFHPRNLWKYFSMKRHKTHLIDPDIIFEFNKQYMIVFNLIMNCDLELSRAKVYK